MDTYEDEPTMDADERAVLSGRPYTPRIPSSVFAPLRAAVADAFALEESEEPFDTVSS